MDKIYVTASGLAAAVFLYWFFLMKKGAEVAAGDSVDIVVEGGYSPEVVTVPRGKKVKLNFLRKDPTDCLEEVVLGDFKIRKKLPLNEVVTVEINPQQRGEYGFACGMNMYHGKIVVR